MRAVQLGHAGDELVDEDLHVRGRVLDLRGEVVVAKQRRYRDAQARDDSLAAALGVVGQEGSVTSCDDALATNNGAAAACTYDCETLRQKYFPDNPAARCFLYDATTQAWPAELLDMRQQRLETFTYVSQAQGMNPLDDLAFTVGAGRTCTNITIVSTVMATDNMATDATHTETVCLVDGQHEYLR